MPFPRLSRHSVDPLRPKVPTPSSTHLVFSRWLVPLTFLVSAPMTGLLVETTLPPSLMQLFPLVRLSLMPEHSFLPRLPLTSTAGVRTPSSPLSSSLTDKIVSLSVRDLTSTLSSPSSTTPVPPILVSTCTPSLSALRTTNPLDRATSPESTMPSCSLSFLRELSPAPPLLRSVCTPLTITCSA